MAAASEVVMWQRQVTETHKHTHTQRDKKVWESSFVLFLSTTEATEKQRESAFVYMYMG